RDVRRHLLAGYAASAHFAAHATRTPPTCPLSLHDALPISFGIHRMCVWIVPGGDSLGGGAALFVLNFVIGGIIGGFVLVWRLLVDRKSTRLNSSHVSISYAVCCLKKKKLR